MLKPSFILSANAVPRVGGQGMNLNHMIQGLRELFELSVFCRGGDAGVPISLVPTSRWCRRFASVPLLRRRRDWYFLLDEIHFDDFVRQRIYPAAIFQGTTGQCLESLTAARANGSFTILDVVTLHNDRYAEELSRESQLFGMRSLQHEKQGRRILQEYERADLIRVMSGVARQTLLERGVAEDKVFVAPPPFDVQSFPQTRFGDRFTVSFVGLLEPAKGFHYLIEAFRKVARRDGDLLLWGNTGSRQMANYVRSQIAACPAIQLRPYSVSELGPGKVYGISSVLVHPSLADGFGYVVGEAMASGIPVITTTSTGASEWIVDGVNGYIVPPRDAGAIAERLEYLMDHPALLEEMGRAARRTIAQLTLQHFQNCYRNALSGRGIFTAASGEMKTCLGSHL